MPSLHTSGRIVIDASSLLTDKRGRELIEEVKNRGIKIYVSDTLMSEYRRNVEKTIGFRMFSVRLSELESRSLLKRIRDEELTKVIVGHDAHLINLALTVGACIIISEDKNARKKAEKHNVKALPAEEFLEDC